MRYIKTPGWLREPSPAEVQRWADRVRLGRLSPEDVDFVLDICNRHLAPEAPVADFRDYDAHGRRRYDTLLSVNLDWIRGSNILQRAMRLLKLIKLRERYEISLMQPVQSIIALLEGALITIENGDPDGMLMLVLQLLAGGDEASDEAMQMAMEFAVQKVNPVELLEICRQLCSVEALNLAKADPVEDPDGEEVITRGIERASEAARAKKTILAVSPDLWLSQVVTRQLPVTRPITYKRKQLLYMLLDMSGSMRQGGRIARAAGVVLNRLEAVMKGEAEVYLRLFDTQLGEVEYHADTPAKARELMEVVTNPATYSGGGTSFEQPITTVRERIAKLVKQGILHDPEFVMITDGEAPVPDLSVLDGQTLHVVQVEPWAASERLAGLARRSGGVNILVGGKDVQVT